MEDGARVGNSRGLFSLIVTNHIENDTQPDTKFIAKGWKSIAIGWKPDSQSFLANRPT